MRGFGSDDQRQSPILTAVVIFLVLVALVQYTGRGSSGPANTLEQQFAASPPAADAGRIELPPVPTNLIALARTTTARLRGGLASAPLNSRGQNEVLLVEIDRIEPQADGIRITGSATNISSSPLSLSLDSFRFTDESNTVYASSGSPQATLQPGQPAPLDISLPIGGPRQLRLDVELPGHAPISLILLNVAPTPAP